MSECDTKYGQHEFTKTAFHLTYLNITLSHSNTILPILIFWDVIYKIASNTLLSKLDAVYHSTISFVTKAPYNTHHCELYTLVGGSSLHTVPCESIRPP